MSPSKNTIRFSIVLSAAALALLFSTPAQSQLGGRGNIMLQASSPGISQSGHANISGTMRADGFIGNFGSFSDFVGVSRTGGPISSYESFGIGDSSTDFDGMYVKTATAGKPYYGYFAGTKSAFHYFDANADLWRLVVGTQTPLQVGPDGVGIGVNPYVGAGLTLGRPIQYQSNTPNEDAIDVVVSGASSRGIESISWGSDGIGVLGRTGLPSGYGVYGDNSSFSTGYGVYGFGWGPTSTGVYGLGGSFGVNGFSDLGYGVQGASNNSHGVIGFSNSAEAVVGVTSGTNKSAVHGYTAVAGSHGGFFWSAATTGAGVGVIGQSASATGYGVQSFGRFMSTGTKAFRIDHPLEPETKFLQHYCSEGPEPLNVYSGVIQTDKDGFATVDLPDYFSSINRDSRVQLTVDDESDDFIMAKVVGGVQENHFRIRTSKGLTKVYWEVKGIRNDPYIQRYGAPVEVTKSRSEAGKYQHPELYDEDLTKAIVAQPKPASFSKMPVPERPPVARATRKQNSRSTAN